MAATHRDEMLENLPTRTASREVWIGVFAILGVVAAAITLLALTDPGMFRGRLKVTTAVSDAGGLRTGDPVQMRGVNMGRVTGFDIGADSVLVQLELERAYPVPEDSRVLLRSSGLLGGMVAEIIPGRSQDDLEGGEHLPGVSERNVLDPASGMGRRADTVLTRVQELLNRETVQDVGASVVELRQLLAQLSALAAEQRVQLAQLQRSLAEGAQGVTEITTAPELRRTLARSDTLSERLALAAGRFNDAGESLEVILQRVETGEGTLGRLSTDEELYGNLDAAAREFRAAAEELRTLIADVRQNPRRYFNLEVF